MVAMIMIFMEGYFLSFSFFHFFCRLLFLFSFFFFISFSFHFMDFLFLDFLWIATAPSIFGWEMLRVYVGRGMSHGCCWCFVCLYSI